MCCNKHFCLELFLWSEWNEMLIFTACRLFAVLYFHCNLSYVWFPQVLWDSGNVKDELQNTKKGGSGWWEVGGNMHTFTEMYMKEKRCFNQGFLL